MKKDYYKISAVFERQGETPNIFTFVEKKAAKDCKEQIEVLDKVLKGAPGGPEDELIELTLYHVRLSFAIGYLYGQMFDICDEELETEVEELKQGLIDEGILKYQPWDKVKKQAKVLEVYKKLEELTEFIGNEFDLSKE